MSKRKAKEVKKAMKMPAEAIALIRPLVASVNERLGTIRVMMKVPDGWMVQHDQQGVPVAFVPPKEG